MVHQVEHQLDFDKQLEEAGTKLVVIDFMATWCGPCKMIAPQIEKMAEEFQDVVFLKVDVDDNEDIASSFQVTCMPTFILLKNKAKIEEFSGANHEKLKELIIKHK